jgi:hypothetical protein
MSEKIKKYEEAYIKCVKKCLKAKRSRRKSCKSKCTKSPSLPTSKEQTVFKKILITYTIDKDSLYCLPTITKDDCLHYYDINKDEFYLYDFKTKILEKNSNDKDLRLVYKIDIKNIIKNHKK